MSNTIVEALKEIDAIQTRLDTLLHRLERSETEKARLTLDLRKAHAEIASLQSQRDTWRASYGR